MEDDDGNDTLIKLTELLRLGLHGTREIARNRFKDYDKLMDISNRAEQMARELDDITGARHMSRQQGM